MSHTAYAGVDVSQADLVVTLLDAQGQPLLSHLKRPNHIAGAREIADRLAQEAQAHGCTRLRLGLEATHVYWLPAALLWHDFTWPQDLEVEIGGLNPHAIKAFRDSLDADREKTDDLDAEAIALHLMVPCHRLSPPLPDPYLAWQRLTRTRFTLARQLGAEKTRALGWLWLLASDYTTHPPFSDLFGTAAQDLLLHFDFPEAVTNLAPQELSTFLQQHSRNHFPDPDGKAAQVQAALHTAYPLSPEFRQALRFVLRHTLQHLASLENLLQHLDQRIAQAVGDADRPLRSIPGLGPVLAAGLLAELGPPDRFPTEAAVARYAGLWWPRAQSGPVSAEDRRLSKAGNTYLRYYLIQAADRVRHHIPAYQQFYADKYRTARTHKHKRALVLTARKLVRLIVALLKSQQEFRMPDPN